jgi:hypothetical protein
MKPAEIIKPALRSGMIISFLMTAGYSSGQSGEAFRVLSGGTNQGIGYVNAGVPAKNIGTVTDEHGYFTLSFGDISDDDSLRFSMIGYESKTLSVKQIRDNPGGIVYLDPRTYNLPELKIVYHRGKDVRLGVPVFSNALRSGFSDNNLGYELGIKINAKKKTKLKNISFNIGICTYDSVTYRLNIYRPDGSNRWENILTKPVYLSFTEDEACKAITFDLREHSIIIEGETIITLEHYKDLGEGKLLFLTQFFTGTTWHRNTRESVWTQSPGQVGIYLNGQQMR